MADKAGPGPAAGEAAATGDASAFSSVQFTFKPPGAPDSVPPAFPAFPGSAEAQAVMNAGGEDVESPEVQQRIEFLKTLQEKRSGLLEQYMAERVALENKYQALIKPLYEKRADVVAGRLDVKKSDAGEFTEVEGFSGGEGEAVPADAQQQQRGVPHFWLQAMMNNRTLMDMVAEEDVPALEHLADVRCMDFEDKKGFKLEFHFSSNPFFTNSVLSKEYHIPNLLAADEPMLQKCTGTEINWRPGKNLTMTEKRMKPRGKKGRGPVQVKQVPKESFFNFFAAVEVPSEDQEIDEEQYEETMHRLELDYTLASIFRESVVPEAVRWYTGEAEEEDDDDEDEDYEDEDDDDDDDDDDDEDDDDDDAHQHHGRGAGRRGGAGRGRRQADSESSSDGEGGPPPPATGKRGGGKAPPASAPGQQGDQQECKQS